MHLCALLYVTHTLVKKYTRKSCPRIFVTGDEGEGE